MDSFQPLRIFGLTCPFLSVKSQLRKTQPMSGQALHNLNCRVRVAMPCHAFKSSASAVGETKISGSTFKVSKGGVTGSSFLSQQRFHRCCTWFLASNGATNLQELSWNKRHQHFDTWTPNPNFSKTSLPQHIPIDIRASSGPSGTHHRLCQPS